MNWIVCDLGGDQQQTGDTPLDVLIHLALGAKNLSFGELAFQSNVLEFLQRGKPTVELTKVDVKEYDLKQYPKFVRDAQKALNFTHATIWQWYVFNQFDTFSLLMYR